MDNDTQKDAPVEGAEEETATPAEATPEVEAEGTKEATPEATPAE